jgi:hypothetical protein
MQNQAKGKRLKVKGKKQNRQTLKTLNLNLSPQSFILSP